MMKEDNYEDIINLPHHTSKKYPRMSLEVRSAQLRNFLKMIQNMLDFLREAVYIIERRK